MSESPGAPGEIRLSGSMSGNWKRSMAGGHCATNGETLKQK